MQENAKQLLNFQHMNIPWSLVYAQSLWDWHISTERLKDYFPQTLHSQSFEKVRYIFSYTAS